MKKFYLFFALLINLPMLDAMQFTKQSYAPIQSEHPLLSVLFDVPSKKTKHNLQELELLLLQYLREFEKQSPQVQDCRLEGIARLIKKSNISSEELMYGLLEKEIFTIDAPELAGLPGEDLYKLIRPIINLIYQRLDRKNFKQLMRLLIVAYRQVRRAESAITC